MNNPAKPKHPPLPPPLTRAQRQAMQANVRRLRELCDTPRPAEDRKPPG